MGCLRHVLPSGILRQVIYIILSACSQLWRLEAASIPRSIKICLSLEGNQPASMYGRKKNGAVEVYKIH
jgi:hypothetical protein